MQTEELEIGEVALPVAPAQNSSEKWLPYLLVLPALLLMIGILYPFFTGVYWSLTDFNFMSGSDVKNWVGLSNYVALAGDKDFWNSAFITLRYVIVCLAVELPLGLGIAMILNKLFFGVRFLRAILILPMMMPPIVAALMWKMMLGSDGVVNYVIGLLGGPEIGFLSKTTWAMWSMTLIDLWIYTPFVCLILLAGLQSLPKEPYEAAQVDGASAWFVFWRLTIPLVTPFIILVTVFRVIDCLKVFDIIYATTKGGPVNATMVMQISAYNIGIRWTNFGKGTAVLTIMWVICYAISFYLTKAWRKSIQRASGL